MKILNKKQIRELMNLLNKQFGFEDNLDYVFVKEGKDYYITNRNIGSIDIKSLNIKRIGIFFGRVINNNFILSIEGSQIVGSKSKKNIIDLDEEEVECWFKGMNIMKDVEKGIYLVRYKKDFIGSCKAANFEMFNSLDKNRKVFKLKI
ncbi:hypothetical protein J4414_00955 [Candidatus Woesearchaeota archaeon]|nr:hypothetical protein [Candidatus Woesearchaeota archaeon]